MKEDLTNKEFGSLKVQRFDKIVKIGKSNHRQWLCLCVCGKETVATTAKLNYGHRTSCGCRPKCNLSHQKNSLHHGWKGYKNISGSVWNRIKANARLRKIALKVTIEEVQELFEKQNHRCAISGVPLYFAQTSQELKDGKNTASLDRIDSSKEYTLDNVQWVHKDINYMKTDFDQDTFIKLCHAVSNYQHEIERNVQLV